MPKRNLKIAIVGSRDFPDMGLVERYVRTLDSQQVVYGRHFAVVTGGARGVDQVAEQVGRKIGLNVEVFPAEWRDGQGNFDKGAGYRRNLQVVQAVGKVVAFWDGVSKGTKHTIDIALREKVDVEVWFPHA